MTEKQLGKVIEELGLIDLGDAILYLDEEGRIDAVLSTVPLEHGSHKIVPAGDKKNTRKCA